MSHIITTQDLLPKLEKLQTKTPKVTTIIYIEGVKQLAPNEFNPQLKLVPFSQLLNTGKAAPEDLSGVSPNEDDTAIILYTSGKDVLKLRKEFQF